MPPERQTASERSQLFLHSKILCRVNLIKQVKGHSTCPCLLIGYLDECI